MNTLLYEVFMAIKNTPNLVRRPNPIPPYQSMQRDKFYEFYQDLGYTTEQCIELTEFVEDLSDKGYI